MMQPVSANFEFLKAHGLQLFRLAEPLIPLVGIGLTGPLWRTEPLLQAAKDLCRRDNRAGEILRGPGPDAEMNKDWAFAARCGQRR